MFDSFVEGEILDRVQLQRAIDQLSDRHKAVIGLVMSKYTRRETAILLGIPRSTIANIYHEGLELLRQEMIAH